MAHIETSLSSETIYEGKILSLHKDRVLLENGHQTTREVVLHRGGVAIVALTPEKEVLLVQQYRYPYHRVLTELPAGKREDNEDPLVCGQRELEEETGYRAERWISLGHIFPSPGYLTETLYLYLALDLKKAAQHLDADEFLDVQVIPFDQAVQSVLENQICDAKTVVGLLKAQAYLQKYPD